MMVPMTQRRHRWRPDRTRDLHGLTILLLYPVGVPALSAAVLAVAAHVVVQIAYRLGPGLVP